MRDQQMMAAARNIANEWLAEDPEMRSSDSEIILRELANQRMKKKDWSGIS
jgi:hypothetical protein